MGSLGYLVYLGFVLIPGLGVSELFGLFRKESTLVERFAIAFGFGLSIDTLVMAIRTSGFVWASSAPDLLTVEATIAGGLALLLAGVVLHRRLDFPRRPVGSDLVVLALMGILSGVILLYFQKYPIFPQYFSYDPLGHALDVQSLLAGTQPTIPAGILYFGLHYQFAAALLLTGSSALDGTRAVMAILVVLSTSMFYLVGQRIFSSPKVALTAALFYALSGAIWFVPAFDSGIYNNFFGVDMTLFLVVVFIDLESSWSRKAWVGFLLALPGFYFSHYTAVTIIPALLLVPALGIARKKEKVRTLLPFAVLVAPIVAGIAAYPSVLSTLLTVANSSGAAFSGGTTLSGALAGWPVLGYMVGEYYYDIGFLMLLVLGGICLWKMVLPKLSNELILPVWMASVMVVSPFGLIAWRYSYEALVPLMLLAAGGASYLVPAVRRGRRGNPEKNGYWRPLAVIGVILLVTVAGAWTPMMVAQSASGASSSAQNQSDVLAAITWLGSNTPSNASFLSVSDWRFIYTEALVNRFTVFQYEPTPTLAITALKGSNIRYIVVTNIVTVSLAPVPSLFPWNNFPTTSNSTLALLYSNEDVRIYKVAV